MQRESNISDTYSKMSDDELLRLANQKDSLLSSGQEALKIEMQKRGMEEAAVVSFRLREDELARQESHQVTPEKSRLKDAAYWALGLAIMAGVFLLIALLMRGIVWASDKALPFLLLAGGRTFDVCFFVFLPFCIFRKTRPWAGLGFVLASYVFGTALWAFSCIVVVGHWGYVGLIVGLLFAGVGVLPVAFLASLFHAEWYVVLELTIGLVLTFFTRFVGLAVSK
jgi:hypothetical protein